MVKKVIPVKTDAISEGIDFIKSVLEAHHYKRKYIVEALLLSEESMIHLIDNATEGTLHITIKPKKNIAYISLSAPGTECQPINIDAEINFNNDDVERSSENAIRGVLLRSYKNKINYAHKGKFNFIKITVGMPEQRIVISTLTLFLFAIAVGVIIKLVLPKEMLAALDSTIFLPIETIFLNALKLTIAPAIFFSIISNTSKFASFLDPGKVSVKVVTTYVLTSVIAVLIGFFAFQFINPGTAGEMSAFAAQQTTATAAGYNSVSEFIAMLIGIVPDNVIEPFFTSNTLQLIFLALICGVAIGRIYEYSNMLMKVSNAMESLCSKVAEILNRAVPFVVFFATISIVLNMGLTAILSLLEMCGTVILGLVVMMAINLLMIAIFARVNPFTYLKKYAPTMKETFFLGSGLAALPKTIRACKNELGISPKIYSFSVPFGAMANLDGNCIYLAIVSLFFAKVCGIEIFSTNLIPMIISIVILSIGAPIAPGSVLLCMAILLNQMGVSISALGLLLGVNSIMEMLLGTSDTAGDVAVSLIVARSEKLLNLDVYRKKKKLRRS